MKKSVASKPCAARNLMPGGSRPVFLSSMTCAFHDSLSSTNALIMVQLPHSRFRKYGSERFEVPHDSRPVDITPGTMTMGWCASRPSERALMPVEKAS